MKSRHAPYSAIRQPSTWIGVGIPGFANLEQTLDWVNYSLSVAPPTVPAAPQPHIG